MKKIEQVLSPRFIIVQGTLVALRNRNIQFALFILILEQHVLCLTRVIEQQLVQRQYIFKAAARWCQQQLNPIPTGCCHVTLIYGLIPPMASRNRVNWRKTNARIKHTFKIINVSWSNNKSIIRVFTSQIMSFYVKNYFKE